MGKRHRIASMIAATVVALVWHTPTVTPSMEIATASVAMRTDGSAARTTESVHYSDAALTLLGSYPIANHTLPNVDIEPRAQHVWSLAANTLPDDALDLIRQLNVVTDGQDQTLAMVHRSILNPHEWVLSIDPEEDDDVLVSTLVHEYAHMLTLQSGDVTGTAATAPCTQLRIEIGCVNRNSFLAQWHDEFWVDMNEPAPTDQRQYVSDYAASSVHEDLAESFMAWVLDEVAHPTVAVRERFAFFEERDVFVQARLAVRLKLGR